MYPIPPQQNRSELPSGSRYVPVEPAPWMDDPQARLVALRVAKAAPSGDFDPYADPDGNPVPGFNVRG